MRIYVDFDDVLCETARAIMRVANARFGRRVAFEQIRWFDLARSFELSREQHAELMDAIHASEHLLGMEAIPGAAATLAAWTRAGADVRIVTGRPPACAGDCRLWLERCGVPHAGLTFVDKYGRNHARPAGEPVLTLAELARERFDLAVEDAPEMALFLARQAVGRVLLFDRPWNRSLDPTAEGVHGRLVRCRDWADVAAHAAVQE